MGVVVAVALLATCRCRKHEHLPRPVEPSPRRRSWAGSGKAPVDTPRSNVRPKDAAISCSYLWALALLVGGITEFIVGAVLFSEWEGLGAFWVGAIAIGAGIAGLRVNGGEPFGGLATGFYMFLSFVTLAAAWVSIALGDGIAYLVVRETEGNCFEADDCPEEPCGGHECVCWKPDGSVLCSGGSSLRYCLNYGGEACGDLEDSKEWLLCSSIMLLIVAFFSTCSLVASVSTCCFCKRVIIVGSSEEPDSSWR